MPLVKLISPPLGILPAQLGYSLGLGLVDLG